MRRVFSALVAVATIGLAACGGSSMGPTGTPGNPPNTPGGTVSTNSVSIGNDFFSPANIRVSTGTAVTWTWNSNGVAHTVTFDDGAQGSGAKSSGMFSRTFTAAGTYTYYCQIHGRAVMSGSITVQ
ncbi:MAG TPA: plastocyanin/azurin family copper-binding protein [Gemmatimonadaceae bacterium]|nr:plastocyanin/azurin family copper-binding protein [Gemmatimonadaceae bacterium]